MKGVARVLIVVTAVALGPAALAMAQEPVTSFAQLSTRVKPGDTVWVTDAQGREIKGRVHAIHPDALTLEVEGRTTLLDPRPDRTLRFLSAGDVNTVERPGRGRAGVGALVGLGVGAASGVVLVGLLDGDPYMHADYFTGALLLGSLCAGVGAGIGALVPGRPQAVYRAPGPAGELHARISFAPLITPRTKGLAFSVSF